MAIASTSFRHTSANFVTSIEKIERDLDSLLEKIKKTPDCLVPKQTVSLLQRRIEKISHHPEQKINNARNIENELNLLVQETENFPYRRIEKTRIIAPGFSAEGQQQINNARNSAIEKYNRIVAHNEGILSRQSEKFERNKTIAKVCLAAFAAIAVYRSYT